MLENCKLVMQEVNKVVMGKGDVVKNILVSIIAGGNILLEDIPGVGKTTIAMAFAKAMSLTYGRMQFTPDVMPSDVTGFTIYNKQTDGFEYKPGVIMCNFFLADEINRTSSKTQSALLEVMEEKKVTVDGTTHLMKKPFIVMATQNPMGSIGTSELPESQLDRFMMKLSVGYPDYISEINMLKTKERGAEALDEVNPVISAQDVIAIQNQVANMYVHNDIYSYIVRLVNATRNNEYIKLGVSPRGTVAITNAAKAYAFLMGREYVVPDDVKSIFYEVVNHRIILSSKAKTNHMTVEDVISKILQGVETQVR